MILFFIKVTGHTINVKKKGKGSKRNYKVDIPYKLKKTAKTIKEAKDSCLFDVDEEGNVSSFSLNGEL